MKRSAQQHTSISVGLRPEITGGSNSGTASVVWWSEFLATDPEVYCVSCEVRTEFIYVM
jgi:hypothetical protein